MRSLMLFAGLILSASLAVAQNPQDQRTQEAKPALRYSFAVSGATPSKYHVANVPRFVRAIPLHRDDDYLSGSSFATQPVVDDSLGSFSIATYSFELTASYRWIETGSRLGWASVSSDRVQQNQFGTTERGSGTSLRFYEVSSKVPISFVLFGGVRLPIVKPRPSWGGLALSLGAQYEPFGTPLHFRAGWDRSTTTRSGGTSESARSRPTDRMRASTSPSGRRTACGSPSRLFKTSRISL